MPSYGPVCPGWKEFSPNFSSFVLSPGRTNLAKHPWVFVERGEKARPAVRFVRNDNSCKSLLRAHSTAAHLIASQTKSRETFETHKPARKEFALVTA